jgi:hypothetical protein
MADTSALSEAERCVKLILESYGVKYTTDLLTEAVLRDQLARDEVGDLDFFYEIFSLDETLIATALAQIVAEGGLDDDARPALAIALARQSHPLVLAGIFAEKGSRVVRGRALAEAARLIEAAGPPPKPKA